MEQFELTDNRMILKDELEKFTVLQLKEKLKSRKLATSGAKPELITRLYDNMLAEESLLGVTGGDNDSAGTSEFDLSNVDVDEVLGMESDLLSPTTVEKKSALKPAVAAVDATKTPVTDTNAGVAPAAAAVDNAADEKPKKAPKPQILAPEGVTTTKKQVKRPAESSAVAKTDNGDVSAISDNNGAEKNGDEAADDKKSSGLSAEEGQKLLLISKKLGLPCKGAEGGDGANTDEAQAKRARRFGPVDEESGKKQSRLGRFGLMTLPATDEKKQKRAERFGPIVTDSTTGDEKKKSRAERFDNGKETAAAAATPEMDEKMRKRAERFGTAAN